MKKTIYAFTAIALLCSPILAKDVDVVEVKSIPVPAIGDGVAKPPPTPQELAIGRVDAEKLIESAYYVLREFESNSEYSEEVKRRLKSARAVLVFPSVFKAGWILGVSTGRGVLLARSKDGTWSYPSFYFMNDASLGLQVGINNSRMLMVVSNGRGLGAIIDNEFKAGASLDVSVANVGSSIGYGTTTNLERDIYTYSISQGAFIGASINASSIKADDLMNQAYYGSNDATAQSVTLDGEYANKSADALRKILSKY